MHSYCVYVANIVDENDIDKMYHDHHYGVPETSDNELFCRLVMEINQAGLSWRTILVKEKGLRNAYHNFDITKVARYGEKDFTRLMNDTSIIRHRLKIHAAIHNANQLLTIKKEFGSFRKWIDIHSLEYGNDTYKWLTLFKKNFKFVGGEIVKEFLMSIGMFPGSHGSECARYKK